MVRAASSARKRWRPQFSSRLRKRAPKTGKRRFFCFFSILCFLILILRRARTSGSFSIHVQRSWHATLLVILLFHELRCSLVNYLICALKPNALDLPRYVGVSSDCVPLCCAHGWAFYFLLLRRDNAYRIEPYSRHRKGKRKNLRGPGKPLQNCKSAVSAMYDDGLLSGQCVPN